MTIKAHRNIGEHNVLKRFTKLIVSGLIFLSSGLAVAAPQAPHAMIEEVANKAFARIKAEQSQIKTNPELMRVIMEEELLPYIDYKFSALKVLGKSWNKGTKSELIEYISVFRSYLITSYAVALGYYNGQEVLFQPVRALKDNAKSITVRAVIKDENRPDINLAFKLRKVAETNEWKVFDIIAEGISMLSSKQSDFESILRKDGIPAVTKIMQAAIEKPLVLESTKKDD